MTPSLVESTAYDLLTKYGLYEKGWRFKFNTNKSRLGVCRYLHKTIELSLPYVKVGPEWAIFDTIKHEMAHALVGPGYGHKWVWKAKAIELGAKPVACKGISVPIVGRYVATCTKCGYITYMHRKPNPRGYGHRNCGGELHFKVNNVLA